MVSMLKKCYILAVQSEETCVLLLFSTFVLISTKNTFNAYNSIVILVDIQVQNDAFSQSSFYSLIYIHVRTYI